MARVSAVLLVALVACAREHGSPDAASTREDAAVADVLGDAEVVFDAAVELDAGTSTACEAWRPALGARVSGGELTISVYSQNATRLIAELYRAPTGESGRVVELTNDPATGLWTGSATVGLEGPYYYGLRAWGPNWPFDPGWTRGSTLGFVADVDLDGHRFNPNKLLIDPYALELSHDPRTPSMDDPRPYRSGPQTRAIDTGSFAAKGVVGFDDGCAAPRVLPQRPFRDEIIYEVHLKGLTANDPSIPAALRGTYRGAGMKAAYLAELGVTAIELLPLHETPNDTNDLDPSSNAGDNYWGYSSLSYFAPDRRYSSDKSPGGPTRELRWMVDALHAHGIEVYVDVVYNHSAEGGLASPPDVASLLSWRGLDNATYYHLAEDAREYVNRNGVGANLNVAAAPVQALILDSLRYWRESLGVDGFRFDLASVLGNRCERGCFEYRRDGGLLERIAAEIDADLIAEPWGVGPGTYQLGQFPAGWSEWNDQYRKTLRKDQNRLDREPITPRTLLSRLHGSPDLFARGVSVNYIASHDGFTLRDVYAFNQKVNDQSWPYGPSDGGDDDNDSWDQGGDPARQRQAARTGLALLMLSVGVPMITGGDELYRTQYGNNNAYNLDSDKNWIDWAQPVAEHAAFARFARGMIQFRRAHPALRALDSAVTVYDDAGRVASAAYLGDPAHHFVSWRLGDDGLYVAYNGWSNPVVLTFPPTALRWHRALDTGAWLEAEGNIHAPGLEPRMPGTTYELGARSAAVFIAR